MDKPSILIIGDSGVGKDTAGDYLASIFNWTHAGSTSKILISEYCKYYDISEDLIKSHKALYRNGLKDFANKLWEKHECSFLFQETRKKGNIVNGVRRVNELHEICRKRQVDFVLRIAADVPKDPTNEIDGIIAVKTCFDYEINYTTVWNDFGDNFFKALHDTMSSYFYLDNQQ